MLAMAARIGRVNALEILLRAAELKAIRVIFHPDNPLGSARCAAPVSRSKAARTSAFRLNSTSTPPISVFYTRVRDRTFMTTGAFAALTKTTASAVNVTNPHALPSDGPMQIAPRQERALQPS